MFSITIPNFCTEEIKYTCFVVFTEWLGIEYEINHSENNFILISANNHELKLSSDFFIKASSEWLSKESMPKLPLKRYNLEILRKKQNFDVHIQEKDLPVLYGTAKIELNKEKIDCGIDLLGGIFFMISRYEEIVIRERDNHNRFSAKSSVAYKENFLFRPIVNEYLELLFSFLKFMSPKLERKPMIFKIFPTHDVDVPFEELNVPLIKIIRNMGGDFLKRKSISLAINRFMRWKKVNNGQLSFDRNYSAFDFLMTESEKRGLKSAFYFLPSSSPGFLIQYPVSISEIKILIQEMDSRGHEIGIHGFYGTFLNQEAFQNDVNLLKIVLEQLKIRQQVKGGRQHYLQWQNPETFRIWENAGMEYDSTLSYADIAGFRCGTCYEYTVYDCLWRRPLQLKERPMIAMDCSVISECYMGLGLTQSALNVFKQLKDQCKYYNGSFVLLFHNNEFQTIAQKDFYRKVLDC